jgi:hypothetical protein
VALHLEELQVRADGMIRSLRKVQTLKPLGERADGAGVSEER